MKKIVSTTLVVMALASGVMANSAYIKGGAYSTEADTSSKPSTTGYEVGFGGNGHFESTGNFLFGGEVDYGYQSFEFASGTTNDMSTYGGQLHLGWTFIDDLDVFGIIGYYGTSMDYTFSDGSTDTVTGYGMRYGAGVDYTIWKHLSVGVEYTTTDYDLTAGDDSSLGNTKFTNIGGNIKFRF
ncbi:MAG: outer membrane beta-barrel protein [Sulfurimonas sp.]